MTAMLLGLALLVLVAAPAQAGTSPTHVLGSRTAAADLTWGGLGDTTITSALAHDDGTGTAGEYSWLADGIALRSTQGWADPTALTYLHAALAQPNPYGLNYAYDAFGDGTLNPASTVYTITLYQVGEALLDAYRAGHATQADVVNVMRLVVATPRIAVPVGMGLAYSNSPNDAKPGYVVHNVDQAIAMFLRDCQAAGITWSTTQVTSWISQLGAYEKSTYQPKIYGWAYRSGGTQAIQDAGHNGLGVIWSLWWDPSSIGVPALNHMQSTDYGVSQGAGVHATLARFACTASAQWKPEYQTFEATGVFASESLMTPRLGQDAPVCDTVPQAKVRFSPRRITQGSTQPKFAPDMGV